MENWSSYNYQHVLKKKVPIARDCRNFDERYQVKPPKEYNYFDNYNKLVHYIKNDEHCFEILTNDKRKLYIDIDHIDKSIEETEEIISVLSERISILLKVRIKRKDIICLVNDDTSIKSIHLIFTKIAMSNKCQLKLINFINESDTFDDESLGLDDNVYSKNKLFRMVNQSKLEKGKVLIPIANQPSFSIKDTFINNTEKMKLYSFDKVFYNENKENKEVLNIDVHDIIDYIIDNCKDVFDSTSVWCKITMLIKKDDLYDLKEWNIKSIENTTKDRYTLEKNREFIESIKCDNVCSTVNYLYKVASGDKIIRRKDSQLTDYQIMFLSKYFDKEEMNQICSAFLEYKLDNKKNYIININDKEIDLKHGFIDNKNFFYDNIQNEFEDFVLLDTIENCKEKLIDFLYSNDRVFCLKSSWGTGKTFHIIRTCVLKNINNTILLVTESNALNKTLVTELNNAILESFHNDEIASLKEKYKMSFYELYLNEMLCPRMTEKFDKLLFHSHLEFQDRKNKNINSYNKMVCSIQSIAKLKGNYDFVIIDEFESVLNSYNNDSTFKNISNITDSYRVLEMKMQSCIKLLCLDADISNDKMKLLKRIMNEENLICYKNIQRSFQETTFNIHTNENALIYDIYENLKQKKKIVISSSVKSSADKLFHYFTNTFKSEKYSETKNVDDAYQHIKHTKILYVNCNGVYLYQSNGEKHINVDKKITKDTLFEKFESYIIENKVDVLIYTPTIKVGLSFNSLYFDKTYGISSSRSVSYLEFMQMIFRVRKLKDNCINLLIPLHEFKIAYNKDVFDMERKMNIRSDVIKVFEDACTQFTDNYAFLQQINHKILYNTERNLTYNIICILKYHHLNYVYNTEICDSMEVTAFTIKKLEIDTKYYIWLNIPIITSLKEYITLKKMKEEGQEIENADSFYKTRFIFGILKIDDGYKDSLLYEWMNNYIKEDSENFRLEMKHYDIDSFMKPFNSVSTKSKCDYYDMTIQNLLDDCDSELLYDIYKNHREMVHLAKMIFHNTTFNIYETLTNDDELKITRKFTSDICDMFSLKQDSYLTITNKELVDKFLLSYDEESITKILRHDFDLETTFDKRNKRHVSYLKQLVKKYLKKIDFNIHSDMKNSNNWNSKNIITSNNYHGKGIINYPIKKSIHHLEIENEFCISEYDSNWYDPYRYEVKPFFYNHLLDIDSEEIQKNIKDGKYNECIGFYRNRSKRYKKHKYKVVGNKYVIDCYKSFFEVCGFLKELAMQQRRPEHFELLLKFYDRIRNNDVSIKDLKENKRFEEITNTPKMRIKISR